MRLQKYVIDEKTGITHVLQKMWPGTNLVKTLQKECKQYIKLLKKHNLTPFYRGIYENVDFVIKKAVRQDRTPSGTPDEEFKKFNKWLSKHRHVRRDKSVSVSSNLWDAEEFGKGYYFFPIGKFNYTWILAKDVNLDDKNTGWLWKNLTEFFMEEEYETEREKNRIKILKEYFPKWFTTNKGIETAHKKEYEIWFDCKSYYAVNWRDKNGS